jgi:hypothetical protein
MLKLANIVTKKTVSIRETLLALPLNDEQYIAEETIASMDIRKVASKLKKASLGEWKVRKQRGVQVTSVTRVA